jgi:TRAP-type C4-dicarboxylate transport system substrate-binding protein
MFRSFLPFRRNRSRRAGPIAERMKRRRLKALNIVLTCKAALAATWLSMQPVIAQTPLNLRIVGGLGGVSQYTEFEEPFWRNELAVRSGGRMSATIQPYDRIGLRGQEMLQLIRLGVVPFGSVNVSFVTADEPEIGLLDLPGLSPDVASLRRLVSRYRPHMEKILKERYDVRLLGVYAYPAQVLFCNRAFAGLDDLKGRRIRTSSDHQSQFFAALGATPILIPFSEIAAALRNDVVDCAVTGTLSAMQVGLSPYMTHVHDMAVSWGLSVFGANLTAWSALQAEDRALLTEGVADLESRIMDAVGRATAQGLACAAGSADCVGAEKGRMTRVPTSPADEGRRHAILRDVVLPQLMDRCGESCLDAWNERLASAFPFKLGLAGEAPAGHGEPRGARAGAP